MNLSIPKLFFSTMLVFRVAEAFVLKPAFQSKSVIGKPLFYVHDDNEHSEESLTRNNKARTDVRNFLTQRSIQSFVFLLGQVRDEHTARWMEVRSL